jgi:hypothetical protein
MNPRVKSIAIFACVLIVGVVLGGYIFHDTRPRSFLALPNCNGTCLSESELVGLLVSVGVKHDTVPNVVLETDKTIALKSPDPLATVDFLVLPKKDIRDLGDLSPDDTAYLDDAFQVMASLVRKYNLKDYKVITNGPGFQQANYLHFHLLAQ